MCQFILKAVARNPQSREMTFVRFTNDSCDCDVPLGKPLGPNLKEREKMKKRGWSEAKIKRAEESALQSRLHHQRGGLGYEAHMNQWIERITQEVQKEGWLGLLLHWGDPPPVVVPLTKKEIALQNLNRETLGHMEQEVLYVFTA